MRALSRVLALVLLVSGLAVGQGVPGALLPCKMDGSDCAPATGTVTTTGTLAPGQVALGSGATSVTSDPGLTGVGTGTGFKLGIGTDLYLSRASAGTLLVEDGSGNPRDVQARTGTFGTSVVVAGSASVPAIVSANTSAGFGFDATGTEPTVFFGNNRVLSMESATTLVLNGSVQFTANTPAVLQLGRPNAASPVSQTLQAQGSRGGTDTNVAGGNLTIRPGAGTGSATGSSIVFQTPTATGSGTDAQTQATRLTLSEPAVIAAVPVRLAGYTVATLPSGTVGDTAYVTDATAPTYLGALTGGGAVVCPVIYNGAAWVSH